MNRTGALAWLRRLLPWVTGLLAVTLLYDGAVFYGRWSGAREAQRAKASEEAEQARKTLEMLGGDELGIVNFYASPGVLKGGEHSTICYSVKGAKTVEIEPPVERVWPAVMHCLQVTPRQNTQYKLTARDAAGHSVTASFLLQVVR